jgi:hypothetical protein
MNFHLITGFGKSVGSFTNEEDYPDINQEVHQGSSSATHIYTMNSDVSLSAYRLLGKGALFAHPIQGDLISDIAVQYVDDKTQFINPKGAGIPIDSVLDATTAALFQQANCNT